MLSTLFARLKDKEPDVKSKSEKSTTATEFIRSPETRKMVSNWTKGEKGKKPKFTRRGVEELLKITWLIAPSDKRARKRAEELLSSLIGQDGLNKVLGALKLASEGIMKKLKAA